MKSLKSNLNKTVLFLILVLSFNPGLIASSDKSELGNLKRVIILENGRLKPLDTFARNILKEISAKSKLKKKSALEWMADVIFNPSEVHDEKIFLVNNDEVLNSVGLFATRGRDRYSHSELAPYIGKLRALAIKASRIERKSQIEQEIVTLYNKIYVFDSLLESFSFLRPDKELTLNDEKLKEEIGLPKDRNVFSFYELALKSEKIKEIRDNSSDEQQKKVLETLIHNLDHKAGFYSSLSLKIIPGPDHKNTDWITPWNIALKKFNGSDDEAGFLPLFQKIIKSYSEGKFTDFDKNIGQFNKLISEQMSDKNLNNRIGTEIFYNRIDPFYKSEFFYGFSLLFLLISFIAFRKTNYYVSLLLLIAGIIPHTYGMIARMKIMGRPPVTNLYETFIFASWITVLLGLILEFFKKKNIGILTGSISGLILLMISGKYALEGDTMGMLVAVLDSNFWLATHVITITVGYGGIVLSGALGHLYVFQKLFVKKNREKLLKDTFQSVYSTQAFGLIFTFIGTVLGGIWADQSWGRFWGWDPKENGALLIVLWSAILFHAKLGKMFKETGFSIGSIVGIINVVLAWFGVNLLGVGLHSYGFSSKVAYSLVLYVILELIFIFGASFWFARKKLPNHRRYYLKTEIR